MDTRPTEPPTRPLDEENEAALVQAWSAYEAGELERAGREVERLMRRTKRHPQVRLLQAVLWLEAGQSAQALADLEACSGATADRSLLAFYRGLALFDLARFEEAEAALQEAASAALQEAASAALQDAANAAHQHGEGDGIRVAGEAAQGAGVTVEPILIYHRAQVREHLGRFEEAEEDYRLACEADPQGFPMPLRMTREEFREAVVQAGDRLPDPVRERLNEVPVVVEDLPPPAILAESGDGIIGPDLLGLFVGLNLREESVFEIPGVPPAIYIYQRNLERVCSTRRELIEEITTTLYHELGHYLGLDEEELRERDLD